MNHAEMTIMILPAFQICQVLISLVYFLSLYRMNIYNPFQTLRKFPISRCFFLSNIKTRSILDNMSQLRNSSTIPLAIFK